MRTMLVLGISGNLVNYGWYKTSKEYIVALPQTKHSNGPAWNRSTSLRNAQGRPSASLVEARWPSRRIQSRIPETRSRSVSGASMC